jgi:type I restriction enzyme S subunit
MAALRDCCNKIESGGTPKRSVIEYWNGRYSWLTSGEVRNPIVFETKETITDEGLKDSSAKLWPHGTTVIAMYGATAGEVCLIASPMTANQACCGLIPRPSFRAFLFFCSRRECENLASKSSGSAQQNLTKGLVERHAILLPNVGVVAAYEAVVGLLLDRWIEGERHSQTLANLRNTLLPRLISGQLRLPDSSAILESVA